MTKRVMAYSGAWLLPEAKSIGGFRARVRPALEPLQDDAIHLCEVKAGVLTRGTDAKN